MVGEQGSSLASSYTDIKEHLRNALFNILKPWVGTLQGGINSVRYARAELGGTIQHE